MIARGAPLYLLALAACGAGEPAGGPMPVSRDSAGVTIIESERPRLPGTDAAPFSIDSAPAFAVGVTEGDPRYELFRVSDALSMPDGRLVISNSGTHQLRVFDGDGDFVADVGRSGDGPGEFGNYSYPQLYLNGPEVVATDDGAFRVHIYEDQLDLIQTRRIALTKEVPRPIFRGIFADGSWLVLGFEGGGLLGGAPGTVLDSRVSLFHYDTRGNFLDSLGTFESSKRYVNSVGGTTNFPYLPFTSELLVGTSGNEMVTLREDTPELAYRDRTGKVVRIVRWHRDRVRSSELWPRYKALNVAALANADERTRTLYGAFFEQDLPLPEFAPLYQTLRVDGEKRVWLERYRMPDETARVWDVIDADGAWLGTITTPRALSIYRISHNQLLGRTLDSLGVEHVAAFAFHASP
jgi:hypothetical protein